LLRSKRPPNQALKANSRQGAKPKPAAGTTPARARRIGAEARRQAILKAALSVFAAHGFEAARLDDMAARAGVAKGTLYLYFRDKEALFEALIRDAIDPVLQRLQTVAAVPDMPLSRLLEALFSVFQTEMLGTERKLLVRLIIAEGPRFPAIAEFHYRNVVSRILPLIRSVAQRAVERGELRNDALARFPQLIAGPLLLAILWDAMFAKLEPLDVAGFLRAHREMLTGERTKGTP
jgi:AcrR family transcriptional regulator